MKPGFFIFLIALLAIFTIGNAIFAFSMDTTNCERAYLNPLVYKMCMSEVQILQDDQEKLNVKMNYLASLIFADAEKEGKKQQLSAALNAENKTPSQEYMINRYILNHKILFEEIEYDKHKIKESKEELDQIMTDFLEKNSFPKKVKK